MSVLGACRLTDPEATTLLKAADRGAKIERIDDVLKRVLAEVQRAREGRGRGG